jgi:hypothetical protein
MQIITVPICDEIIAELISRNVSAEKPYQIKGKRTNLADVMLFTLEGAGYLPAILFVQVTALWTMSLRGNNN